MLMMTTGPCMSGGNVVGIVLSNRGFHSLLVRYFRHIDHGQHHSSVHGVTLSVEPLLPLDSRRLEKKTKRASFPFVWWVKFWHPQTSPI